MYAPEIFGDPTFLEYSFLLNVTGIFLYILRLPAPYGFSDTK